MCRFFLIQGVTGLVCLSFLAYLYFWFTLIVLLYFEVNQPQFLPKDRVGKPQNLPEDPDPVKLFQLFFTVKGIRNIVKQTKQLIQTLRLSGCF